MNKDKATPFWVNGWLVGNDPRCPDAQRVCREVLLPKLEKQFAEVKRPQRERIVTEALYLIMRHEIAPPSWLAAAYLQTHHMGDRKKRSRAKDKDAALKVLLAVEFIQTVSKEDNCKQPSLRKIAGMLKPPMSHAVLTTVLKTARDYEAKITSDLQKRLTDDTPQPTRRRPSPPSK